jgi:hypothetical protein
MVDNAGTELRRLELIRPDDANGQGHWQFDVQPAEVYWYFLTGFTNSPGTFGEQSGPCDYGIQVYCGTQLPNTLESCCPPDPGVMLALNNIISMLNKLGVGSKPPIGWTDGPVHAGLAGAGTITLQGATTIGIRVDMTAPPAGVSVTPGSPAFYWDSGFITPIAIGSPLRGWRLVFNPESFALPEFTDQIGYTLLHGTQITITELLPVPA